jgi:hypothetical protein
MYVSTQVIKSPRVTGLGRMRKTRLGRAASDRIVRRRLAALGYGDAGGIDWSGIITTGINDAATVAKTAVTPPMYSSVVNPLTGASSIQSYGASPGVGALGTSLLGSSSLLSSPLVLFGGLALILVLAFRR